MRDRAWGPGMGVRRGLVAVLLLGITLACAGGACSRSSGWTSRWDTLQQDLSRFHLALLMRDAPALLRQVPLEARAEWSDALPCFFRRYRVVDYRIQEITPGDKGEDAVVVVWVMRHPVDSLNTLESIWSQRWTHQGGGWLLDTESESTRRFLGDCLPPGEG